jgi:hypothetical protein
MPLTPIATSVRPHAPRAAEGVGDDHRDVDPGPGTQRVADVLRRAVGVDGEQRGLAVRHVREVDPGVRAHEAVPRLADDQVAAPAHDPHRLRLDQAAPGVEVVLVEVDHPTLGLRHDLLGDDEAVTVLERRGLCGRGIGDERRDLVAGGDLADALDGGDGERTRHAGSTAQATAASVRSASAAAISGLRIIVSATTACTPVASTSAARGASTASITSVPQISA